MQKVSGKRKRVSIVGKVSKEDITFRELLGRYETDCRKRGIEAITVKGYRFACEKFLDYLQEDIKCSELHQEAFDEYQLELASRVKTETVNSYLFKISPVVRYGREQGYIMDEIHFSRMVCQEHFKNVYTDEEIKKLLKRPTGDNFNEYRTWVVVSVFLGTGIRSLELRSIRCCDLHLEEGYINLPHTKNKEPRIVPLSDALVEILREYKRLRDGRDEEYLFCSIYGDMMGRNTLQTSVARYNKRRGVEKTSIHLFRHTFITLEVRQGVSPLVLRRITGHKNLKMLDNYYNHNVADLISAVNKVSPVEQFSQKKRIAKNMGKR